MTASAHRAIACALAGLAAGGLHVASGAEWRFEPVADAALEWTDNVQLDDPRNDEAQAESDVALRASLRLGFLRRTPRASWTFAYTPAHEAYDEFSDFDNTSHSVSTALEYTLSRRAVWSFTAGWDRRERARVSVAETDLPTDFVEVGVLENDSYSARVQGLLTASERHRWVVAAQAYGTKYDDIEADTPGSITTEVEDASAIGAELAWETDLAERTTVGVQGRVTRLDEGSRGEYETQEVLLGLIFGAPERVQVTIAAGATRTDVIDFGTFEEYDTPTTESGSVSLVRRIGARVSLSAGVSREVGFTRGTGGLAVNDSANARVSWQTGPRGLFAAAATYTKRDTLQNDATTGLDTGLSTLGYRVEWSYAISPRWRVVASAERIDQTAESDAAFEVDRNVAGAGVRFSPAAARR